MRLIGFVPFLIIGIAVGILATRLFNRSAITAVPNCVLGIIGSAVGLFMRDLLAVESGVAEGFLSAAVGAVVLVVLTNFLAPLALRGDDDSSR